MESPRLPPAPSYEAPLRAAPALNFEPGEPMTLLGGRLHRQAIAVTHAVLDASPAAADAQLAAYFSQGKKAATVEVIDRKMRHLMHFAGARGPEARRTMERLLAPDMSPTLLTAVVRDVKHRIYRQCAEVQWRQNTLHEVEHLLLLRAARPEHANDREQADTWELRRLVEMRAGGDVQAFYAELTKQAARPGGEVQTYLLFRALQSDVKEPALQVHAEAVIARLAGDSPLRHALVQRCLAEQDAALAGRFFCSETAQQGQAIQQMLVARGRFAAGGCNGFYTGGHPYDQLVQLLASTQGRLRWQLVGLLTACMRHDLRQCTLTPEELIRRVAPIRDFEVKLRMLEVANERKSPALVAALVGDGADGLRVPAEARELLPGAIMAMHRLPAYVALGDEEDRVLLQPPGIGALQGALFDLARLRGEHCLDEQAFQVAVRDLGRPTAGTTTEPLAHHARVTEAGVQHTILRRISVPGDGQVHATLRCDDAAKMLPLLRSGNWEAKTLSGSSQGEMMVAALHTDLQVDQDIIDLEPKKLQPTLRKKRNQGWQSPSGYVLPDGRHRVLLTRSKSDAALDAQRNFFARLVCSSPKALPAEAEIGAPTEYRREQDYANDSRFLDGSSVAEIEPENFVALAGGEKPYAFHALDLVGSIVSKAKQLRDVRQDPSAAWHNPLTRAPLGLPEIEALRAHPQGWALRDVPLPKAPERVEAPKALEPEAAPSGL